MIELEKTLQEYNLTLEQYDNLLKDCFDKVNKISDLEWSEIMNKYNLDIHFDTARKGCQPPLFGSVFVSEYMKIKNEKLHSDKVEKDYFANLRLEKQEIYKERRKLQDERLDLNKRLRETARLETTIDKINEMLSSISKERYETPICDLTLNKNKAMIITLSDLHIGATFDCFDGEYNTTIAKKRLNEYLNEIIDIQKTHNVNECVVAILGDLISGNIHKTISITNKENVIEQIKLACTYISDFVYELSKYFKTITVKGVSGNHSRIDKKEESLISERLDTLILWFVKGMLENIVNVTVYDTEIDDTLSTFELLNKKYFMVHVDYDAITDLGISKLILWAKETPYCVLCCHKYFPCLTDVSNIKVVQTGSLCGSGNDFTRQKRLTGQPSQSVIIVSSKGIECLYPITFS